MLEGIGQSSILASPHCRNPSYKYLDRFVSIFTSRKCTWLNCCRHEEVFPRMSPNILLCYNIHSVLLSRAPPYFHESLRHLMITLMAFLFLHTKKFCFAQNVFFLTWSSSFLPLLYQICHPFERCVLHRVQYSGLLHLCIWTLYLLNEA